MKRMKLTTAGRVVIFVIVLALLAGTPTLDRRCLLNVQRLSPSISSLAVLIRTV